jgi:hypothetical protein
MTPKPPRFTKGKGHQKLNAALDARVREIVGDGYVCVNRTGDAVTIRLSIDRLLARIPKGGGSTALVKIAGNETGGGIYYGYLWETPPTALAVATDLEDTHLGTSEETEADRITIVNTVEVGQTTHDITEATQRAYIFMASRLGSVMSDHATPRPVYYISNYDVGDCA